MCFHIFMPRCSREGIWIASRTAVCRAPRRRPHSPSPLDPFPGLSTTSSIKTVTVETQLRRVKSTIYLTGKPTNKTKKRMVDLLAPSRSDVVAATAGTSTSRSSSLRGDPACALEDGRGGGGGGGGPEISNLNADLDDYLGVLKDDFEGSGRRERASSDGDDDGGDGSVMGYSAWGGDSILGGREGSALGVSSAHGGSALGGMGRTEVCS